MAYWPLPNTTGLVRYANNYDASGDVAITGNLWNTRWDYYLNPKNSILAVTAMPPIPSRRPAPSAWRPAAPTFGNYAGNSNALNQSLAAGWTYTVSPTVVNEFRLGYMRYHVFDVPNGYGTQPATAGGYSRPEPGQNLYLRYALLRHSGFRRERRKLGYGLGVNQCNCPLTQSERQIQFVDNVHKIVGNHSFKFGADLRYAMNLRVPSDSHRAGELYFNGN